MSPSDGREQYGEDPARSWHLNVVAATRLKSRKIRGRELLCVRLRISPRGAAMLQDFIFGLKLLFKQRAFTAAALLTLALAIGANTAIFTVLENVVLRGLPYPQAERLVAMYNQYPGVGVDRGSNGVPDYLDRRKMTNVFSEVALVGGVGYEVGLEGSPQRIRGENVTPSFFEVLGVRPLVGRTFTEEEAVLGKEKVGPHRGLVEGPVRPRPECGWQRYPAERRTLSHCGRDAGCLRHPRG